MNQLALIPSQFSVGIYTFGTPTSGTSPLTHIYPTVASAYTSADMTTSTDLSSGIDASSALRSPVGPDVANTDFPTAMVDLTKASTAAGDGSSPTSRKKALIIVTDGLADYGSRIIPTTEGPIDPANCTTMKNLGYNVYVLYTTFVQTPNIDDVLLNNTALVPYLNGTASPAMAASLQSCASAPSNYAEASDPAAITAAMKLLLQSALGSGGRFTK
jgi:hypothetical protein